MKLLNLLTARLTTPASLLYDASSCIAGKSYTLFFIMLLFSFLKLTSLYCFL